MLALVALMLIPWLGIRATLPMLQSSVADLKLTEIGFTVLFASPFLTLLALELISRRALGLGFTVVRREESRGEYWFYVGIHALIMFVIVATVFVQLPSK